MTKIPKQQTTWSALDFLENSEQETNAQKSELERRAELRRKLAAEQAKNSQALLQLMISRIRRQKLVEKRLEKKFRIELIMKKSSKEFYLKIDL